jgi:DinB family protein
MGAPDPIGDPAGYQRFLLSLLGDDDPVEVQSETPNELRALVAEAGDLMRSRPEPREWSVLECAGHIVDAEVVSSGRYRWILAHDEPPLIGYDQDLWAERLRHNEDDPEELLALFEALRIANLALWARSSETDRARVGLHQERGLESYELTFRLIAGHDRNHLGQARQALGGT